MLVISSAHWAFTNDEAVLAINLANKGAAAPAELRAQDLSLNYSRKESQLQQEDALKAAHPGADFDRESYDHVEDNPFVPVATDPRSTFSIDVDTAGYALVRRHLLGESRLPPKGAVRIEELVNYFSYTYPEPEADRPFSVQTEVASAPWAPAHRLVRIGIKGRHVEPRDIPGTNLVFLIDVSGSMEDPNKLPLLKRGLSLLVEQLDERDKVSIVVYAAASGLVLPATRGSDKSTIVAALERLEAGGSTNGGEGIQLAYRTAAEHFVRGGINRVILATDGDFNVGVTSQSELVELIRERARAGVFLSVLGFGGGNYNDSMLEKLADKGNGNYAYVDTLSEARKVLVEQATGTLITIAKDVKVQIEFNPRRVEAFRLIGYENRVLAHRDFADDAKDAGEIGADHTVTALYEIVPPGAAARGGLRVPPDDPLKYQAPGSLSAAAAHGELGTVKLRYKLPDGDKSELIEVVVRDRGEAAQPSADFRFAAAVAEFGMLLRNSPHKGSSSYDQVLSLASAVSQDQRRREFIELVDKAKRLTELGEQR
jgi:Ca-activated chloride channel family protein